MGSANLVLAYESFKSLERKTKTKEEGWNP